MALLASLSAGLGSDWAVVLVLRAVGEPVVTAAWLAPGDGRSRPWKRAGCLRAVALLAGLMVLWAMATREWSPGSEVRPERLRDVHRDAKELRDRDPYSTL